MFGSKQKTIGSFEIVTLRIRGMRYAVDYEIVMRENDAELTQYGIRYTNKEDIRIPERRAVIGKEPALKLLNDCKLLSWDGFHGAHPRGVKDGTMFTLEATVNDGVRIWAEGSQNFPRYYREFTDKLNEILE